jgi:hypothetical protein
MGAPAIKPLQHNTNGWYRNKVCGGAGDNMRRQQQQKKLMDYGVNVLVVVVSWILVLGWFWLK